MSAKSDPAPRNTWTTLFQQTSDAVFLLNPRQRLRYVNPAFESVARVKSDAIVHEYCRALKLQKHIPATVRALLQAMAPPKEALAGQVTQVRRPIPPARSGPPWWDITFIPLREKDVVVGILGVIVASGTDLSPHTGKGLSESIIGLRMKAATIAARGTFIGESVTAATIRGRVELASNTLAPVWIVGEPGTGKETLARTIHFRGISRDRSFIGIDCAGLQPYLVRAMLFGHNGLADTRRAGTVYLKSAERLPPDLQQEMLELRELMEGEARIVVGTSKPDVLLPEFHSALGTIEICLSSLRERRDDIPNLIAEWHGTSSSFTSEAMAALTSWEWPSNLRELREVCSTAKQRAESEKIDVGHLPFAIRHTSNASKVSLVADREPPPAKLDDVLEKVERRMIDLAMKKTKGDQTAAAELLGIYRSRLARRLKAFESGEQPETS